MLLQLKVYMIGVLYFFGAIYMILFPPRNYEMSGSKKRTIRSVGPMIQYNKYVDPVNLKSSAQRLDTKENEEAKIVYLSPPTEQNNSVIAIELRSDSVTTKPGILVIGGINAMAWGAPNALIELAEKLLYDSSYQTPYFNDYDWYIIPMANPDGINFTKSMQNKEVTVDAWEWSKNISVRTNSRPSIWHKNIDNEVNSTRTCFGTNINRNFAYHWQDDVHKTPDRCSQYYSGERPFSTAEAQAIRQYIDHLGDTIKLAIHLHASFVPKKEYILYPWRYTLRHVSNYQTLQSIGEYAARNSKLTDGRLYEVHQGSNDGRIAGSLIDYISGVVGTELVFLVKPYHETYPPCNETKRLEEYMQKSITTILSLVRGWRSSNKLNTLSFFGKDVEF